MHEWEPLNNLGNKASTVKLATHTREREERVSVVGIGEMERG